jgi:twitching motility protein PilT
LRPTPAVKNFIRRGEIQHIASAIETGAEDGMWTFDRYRAWMKSRDDWSVPSRGDQN